MSPTRGDTASRATSAKLSVCCMTAGPADRVAAILRLLRAIADEIVVAVDNRADAAVADGLSHVADRIILYPYAEPVDRPLAWLHAQCRGDWILNVDDDEIPSAALVASLPVLLANPDVTHYWLPRRWLFPDATQYLDEPPWRPDYQLRLSRNDPRSLRFSNEFHRPIVALGPGLFLEAPLWHLDSLRPLEARLNKAKRYEHARPGMRIAGRAHNYALHVPELTAARVTTPLPPAEQEVVDAVLQSPEVAPLTPTARIARATREEIDGLWPGRPLPAHAYRARLEALEPARPFVVDEQRTLDVRVHNLGGEVWQWGRDAEPEIRVGSRWSSADGDPIAAAELRTHFPADLRPGESEVVPVHVRAPAAPGRFRLELDLVHEHVRWFGCELPYDVEVRARRRIAIVGDDAAQAEALELLAVLPELEPVLVARAAELPVERHGYDRVAGLGSYLLAETEDLAPLPLLRRLSGRTLALLRAALRVRDGRGGEALPGGAQELLEELARCELLVVAGEDAPRGAAATRELWRLASTVLTARALRVPVALRDGALAGRGPLVDRALAAAARRAATARFDRPLDLVPALRTRR